MLKILARIMVLPICLAAWEPVDVASLSLIIADRLNLPHLTFLHPEYHVQNEVLLAIKALQVQEEANGPSRLLQSVRMIKPPESGFMLQVLLAWLPNAQKEFEQFIRNASFDKPTWLILLPGGVTSEEFIGDKHLPFQAQIIMAERMTDYLNLREAWRVTQGRPLHLVPYGSWTRHQGLVCLRYGCSFFSRSDLEGAPLRAATKEDMPISSPVISADGTLGIAGFFGDIYYELVEQLNATAVVIPAVENVTGYFINGSWNGIIGMMENNETDFAVGPFSMQSAVLEAASFIRPLLLTNYQIFFKQERMVIEWAAFLKPFGTYVWCLILLWCLVAGMVLNRIYRLGVMYGQENTLYTWEFSKVNGFLTFLKAFCQQGSHMTPKSLSCRGLFLTGYLSSSILVTAYSAALISKLALEEPLRPFDSLETFLHDGSYRLTAIASSSDYTYFSEATDSVLKDIYKKLMRPIPEEDLPTGKEEGLLKVCNGTKTALFITFAVTQITAREMAISHKCKLIHFRNPIGTVFLSIGVRKKFPYANVVTRQIQKMAERGIIKRLFKKEWPLSDSKGLDVAAPEVELRQVVQIYLILLIGFILASLVLVAELATKTPRVQAFQRHSRIQLESVVTVVFIFAIIILLFIICFI